MNTIADPQADQIFDDEPYRIPFPKADGHEVTDLAIALAGNLKYDRNNPDHTQLLESLTLGRLLTLRVTCSVDAKQQIIKQDPDNDIEALTHAVRLRIHSATPE